MEVERLDGRRERVTVKATVGQTETGEVLCSFLRADRTPSLPPGTPSSSGGIVRAY